MSKFIELCFEYYRTVLSLLTLSIILGVFAYIEIPKEAAPDVKIPLISINMRLEGVSPEDAESLLVKPVEQKVRTIEGVKEVKSHAYEGGASVIVKFFAGLDSDKSYRDVLDKVDEAKADLPNAVDGPDVKETNISLFPVINVHLFGDVPNRTLYKIANDLQDEIEARIPEVLGVDILGNREEVLEIIIDPVVFESYNISVEQAVSVIKNNNLLISSGHIDTRGGRLTIKVPGLLKTADDLLNTPVISNNDAVVKFKDIANVRRTYKDPQGFARLWEKPSVTLAVRKRTGENILETVKKIRDVVKEESLSWGESVKFDFSQDQSKRIKDMLSDLQNNMIVAIFLVIGVIIVSMGWRSSLLIGIAIPSSFLIGVLVISLLGYTMNIVVLFALILSIGMLVDGAIIVVEDADRNMAEGMSVFDAYKSASIRMFIPVLTSITTTLVVFLPLLFWPGVIGQFMKFLPITLLATLTASLFVATVFIPTIGAIFTKRARSINKEAEKNVIAIEKGEFKKTSGFTRWYVDTLRIALKMPEKVVFGAVAIMILAISLYAMFGKGVEFFPNIDPDVVTVEVRARGNLSVYEKDNILKQVESYLYDMDEFKTMSSTTKIFKSIFMDVNNDAIGQITFEFEDWKKRRSVDKILSDVNNRLQNIPGIKIEIREKKPGPPRGKPIVVQASSKNMRDLNKTIAMLRKKLESMDGVIAIEDDTNIPGIEWVYSVDRSQALKFGANIALVGNAIKLATNGIKVDTFRPDDSNDEIDIVVRFPEKFRNLDQIKHIRIRTNKGLVPISNFIKASYQNKTGSIYRSDGKRVYTIKADVPKVSLPDKKINEIERWIKSNKDSLPKTVEIKMRGEAEDKKEAASFLKRAFSIALVTIAIILMTQFNSFFSMALVLSSIIMSTIGMFLGLFIMNLPFSIVMCGIGVIALSGIIVSNNILMIDTYDRLKEKVKDPVDLLIRTGAQRLRAVILTQLTTSLGLLPIVLSLTINFMKGTITYGEPSTQWWVQLSTSIVFGVVFASPLTLFVTPCILMIREKFRSNSYKGLKLSFNFTKHMGK